MRLTWRGQAFHIASGKGSHQEGVRAKAQAAFRLLKPAWKKLSGVVKVFIRVHWGFLRRKKDRRQKPCSVGGPQVCVRMLRMRSAARS